MADGGFHTAQINFHIAQIRLWLSQCSEHLYGNAGRLGNLGSRELPTTLHTIRASPRPTNLLQSIHEGWIRNCRCFGSV